MLQKSMTQDALKTVVLSFPKNVITLRYTCIMQKTLQKRLDFHGMARGTGGWLPHSPTFTSCCCLTLGTVSNVTHSSRSWGHKGAGIGRQEGRVWGGRGAGGRQGQQRGTEHEQLDAAGTAGG